MINIQRVSSRLSRFALVAVTLVLAAGTFSSCSDEPNATGIGLIPDSLHLRTLVVPVTGDTSVRVRIGGNAANLLTGKSGTYEARSLMEFLFTPSDLVSGIVLDSAVLTLKVLYRFPDSTGDLGFEAHAMTKTWEATTFKWDSLAGSTNAAVAGSFLKTITPADTLIRVHLDTALVRQWWLTGNVTLQLVPS